MISYEGLIQRLNDKGLTKTALTEELGVSSRTVAKIGRGEKIADRVLAKILRFWTAHRKNCIETSQTMCCFKCCVMKKASVCPAACTMRFKSA